MTLPLFNNPLGLDISDYKIRFFQLHAHRGTRVAIRSFGEVEVPAGHIVGGEIVREPEVARLITHVLAKPSFGKADSHYVNVALPEKRIYTKVIQIPNVPDNEVRGAVSWSIEQNIPVTLDQVYFDWQAIPRLAERKSKGEKKLNVLVSAAPRDIVDTYTALVKSVGLTPISLESESVALCRCLVSERSETSEPLMILDIGRSRTNLVIYGHGTVLFTATLDVNGTAMTEAIAHQLQLSAADAEKAKIICGLDPRKGRGVVKKILEPILNNLVTKVSEHIEYFYNYIGVGKKIKTLLLTGSASKMGGLTTFLQQHLNCSASVGNPLVNVDVEKPHREEPLSKKNNLFSFATAIGLALKKFE